MLYPKLDSEQDPVAPLPSIEVEVCRNTYNNNISVNNSSTEDPEPKEMSRINSALRFGTSGLAFVAIVGLGVFVAFFVLSFNIANKVYEYSCPMSAMWMGLAVLWYSVLLLVWWSLATTKSKLMLQVWLTVSILFALEGFLCLVCFAAARNEGAASGLSLLWIVAGLLGAAMCTAHRRQSTYMTEPQALFDGSNASDEKPQAASALCGCGWCCNAQFWLNFVEIFFLLWLFVFSTGIVVQAGFTASDAHEFAPPGNIYTINADGLALRMHLYCFGGSAGTPNATTVVFEHGGGSNSISMLALASAMVESYGTRACIYDRLGYGFSPTLSTGKNALPTSGELLSALLDQAGEAGPFLCAGHSAGAEACLWFAQARRVRGDVRGVAMMDGYPDLISGGAHRPGQEPNRGVLAAIQGVAVAAGATGLTRGVVGNPGAGFVPQDRKATMVALYAQTRFWLAQYWDVKADFDKPEEDRLYRVLDGEKGEDGLVRYGRSLQGVRILVLPADKTTNKTYERTCEDPEKDPSGEFCCGHARNSTLCHNMFADSRTYNAQAQLYAQTLGDVPGKVVFGPKGSGHAFVYQRETYAWVAAQIATLLRD